MSAIFVSVVMPAYNSEQFITEAIQSILSQSHLNFEFIIIDDGSTDKTLSIIKQFDDKRIKLFSHSINKGNYSCRNEGCRIAKGKYICVMDSDDIALPERIEKQVFAMEKDPLLLACGSYFKFINRGICIKPKSYDFIKLSLLRNNAFLHPSLMIRRDILEQIGYYNEEYYYSSDYHLVCKIALKGKIENIPDVLMKYRIHPRQISFAQSQRQYQYANQIRIAYLRNLKFQFSEDDEKMFTLMMTNSSLTNADIEYIKILVGKLIEENLKNNTFDPGSFKQFLDLNLTKCYLRKRDLILDSSELRQRS